MTKTKRLTKKLRAVALESLFRRERITHPSGKFDNAQRWYPDESEKCECCEGIRSPSRSYPYSLMVHCRSTTHMASVSGYTKAIIKWAMKRIEVEWEENLGNTRSVQSIQEYETARTLNV